MSSRLVGFVWTRCPLNRMHSRGATWSCSATRWLAGLHRAAKSHAHRSKSFRSRSRAARRSDNPSLTEYPGEFQRVARFRHTPHDIDDVRRRAPALE